MAGFYIPDDVKRILNTMHNAGYEAYIVGGCVRDMLLGHRPYDYDITTSAEPLEVKALFAKTIDTGLQHGTVSVLMNGEAYEITTYRIDGTYLDSRRPESVTFTKSLEEDLKRRDFTINAMAYCIEDGVVDLFGGQKDLDNGLIRCVGKPEERFSEDALRMLRAIRFAARFGFEIDPSTEKAIKLMAERINNISAERVHVELTKTLCSDNPGYIKRLVDYNLIEHVLPEFMPNIDMPQNNPYHMHTVDKHTYNTLAHIEPIEALRWTMYLHDIGKGYTRTTDDNNIDHFYRHQEISVDLGRDILNRLKFDNKTKNRVLKLIEYHDYRFPATKKSTRKAMAKIGEDLFFDYIRVQIADISAQASDKLEERVMDLNQKKALAEKILADRECFSLKDLAVSGKDLIELGIQPGAEIGRILNILLESVIEDPLLNKKDILIDRIKIIRVENRNGND